MWNYIFLLIAILGEITATSALKASEGFTRLYPSLLTVTGYAVTFYCLSLAVRTIPLGIAYAIWAGIGIALMAIIGAVVFGQNLTYPTMGGIALILIGVVIVNLCSGSGMH